MITARETFHMCSMHSIYLRPSWLTHTTGVAVYRIWRHGSGSHVMKLYFVATIIYTGFISKHCCKKWIDQCVFSTLSTHENAEHSHNAMECSRTKIMQLASNINNSQHAKCQCDSDPVGPPRWSNWLFVHCILRQTARSIRPYMSCILHARLIQGLV